MRYDRTAVVPHWVIGVALGALVVVRLLWRMSHPVATLVLPAWQRRAASAAQYGLYACMLALPLSGFLGWLFPRSAMHVWRLARRDGVFAWIGVFR